MTMPSTLEVLVRQYYATNKRKARNKVVEVAERYFLWCGRERIEKDLVILPEYAQRVVRRWMSTMSKDWK